MLLERRKIILPARPGPVAVEKEVVTVQEHFELFKERAQDMSVKELAEMYTVPMAFIQRIIKSDLHKLAIKKGVRMPQDTAAK